MKTHRSIFQMILFAMLGALLLASKVAFESLPNIHPVTMLIMVYTVVFRYKAIIPIYVFVALSGLFYGFAPWWIAYLYVWAVYWAITLLLPVKMPSKLAMVIYPLLCALFGMLFGTLCAPAHALMYGFGIKGMFAWIASGLSFDAIHALGNLGMGFLVLPLSCVLKKIYK